MSIDGWMGKQNVVYTNNGICSAFKKGNSVVCYNMDKSWRCYAKWNKAQKNKYFMTVIIPCT